VLLDTEKSKNVGQGGASNAQITRWRYARWRGRTDLYYLAHDILGYNEKNYAFGITPSVHMDLINKLQKFPMPPPDIAHKIDLVRPWAAGGCIYPYGGKPFMSRKELPGKRRRLILDFRSAYKTTINCICHSIQWLLNYPDIAMLMVQSSTEKAERNLLELKSHFIHNSLFREIYPDYCPPNTKRDFGNRTEFTLPNRQNKNRKEPSVLTASIDKKTAGLHVEVIKCSDIVEEANTRTPSQLSQTAYAFEMFKNLLVDRDDFIDVEGTRYDFCLHGDTGITMSDWSQKPIRDIQVGDEVVGWHMDNITGRAKRRMMIRSKVLAVGSKLAPCKKYTFASGRSIICTPEHRFWRGKGWMKNTKNSEYGEIRRLKSVRRLLIPQDKAESYDSGWLAAIYDGEGTFRKNPDHPSGSICITQSTHNPGVIEAIRRALTVMGFEYYESWYKPSAHHGGKEFWEDRCNFVINGGWQGRYKFLRQIEPVRKEKIAESLFGQLFTTEDKIVLVEDAGEHEVFFFQCETGNYIADGCCSKNSDLYGQIIDAERKRTPEKRLWETYIRGVYKKEMDGKPHTLDIDELDIRNYERDKDGNLVSWWPERFPVEMLEQERYSGPESEDVFATQMLNDPLDATGKQIFDVKDMTWIDPDEFSKVKTVFYTTTVDTAETQSERSDYTAITTCAWDRGGRCYVCDIRYGRFLQDEIIANLFDVWQKFKPSSIKIEETGFVRGLKSSISHWSEKMQIYPIFEFIPRDTQQSKVERIMGIQAWYKSGDLRFLSDLKYRQELTDQFTRFPKYKYDDILDTIADQFQNREHFGRLASRPTPDETYMKIKERFYYGEEESEKYDEVRKLTGL
jgi:predicted phage terminase large subunit-like protein